MSFLLKLQRWREDRLSADHQIIARTAKSSRNAHRTSFRDKSFASILSNAIVDAEQASALKGLSTDFLTLSKKGVSPRVLLTLPVLRDTLLCDNLRTLRASSTNASQSFNSVLNVNQVLVGKLRSQVQEHLSYL